MLWIIPASGKYVAACGIMLATLFASGWAQAGDFKVLYTFTGGNDGCEPLAGVIADKDHNLYGTTFTCGRDIGGTVFKLAPDDTLTVLHTFSDDGYSVAGLMRDSAGNLYGTTEIGDTVFKIAADGTETVLHGFSRRDDGNIPLAGVVQDRKGDLFGTTADGGSAGCGVVFKVTPERHESVLYAFQCGSDGAYPEASLLLKSDAFYGTTYGAGTGDAGTVFKVSRDGSETVLYAFTGGSDGANPAAALIGDRAGNLYGTASGGGTADCGTIFRLAPDGTFSLSYSFSGSDGCHPEAALLADAGGNLYGTTESGGAGSYGTVFKLAPDGSETLLHSFGKNDNALEPYATLVADKKGNLYGTTSLGGPADAGTIFRVRE
ncbi:MAG TPA: choice-of-anchor tandem repeat GloVer-containing protein [Rhizomicrobium sp.]